MDSKHNGRIRCALQREANRYHRYLLSAYNLGLTCLSAACLMFDYFVETCDTFADSHT